MRMMPACFLRIGFGFRISLADQADCGFSRMLGVGQSPGAFGDSGRVRVPQVAHPRPDCTSTGSEAVTDHRIGAMNSSRCAAALWVFRAVIEAAARTLAFLRRCGQCPARPKAGIAAIVAADAARTYTRTSKQPARRFPTGRFFQGVHSASSLPGRSYFRKARGEGLFRVLADPSRIDCVPPDCPFRSPVPISLSHGQFP